MMNNLTPAMSYYQTQEWREETGEADLWTDALRENQLEQLLDGDFGADEALVDLYLEAIAPPFHHPECVEEVLTILVTDRRLSGPEMVRILDACAQTGLRLEDVVDNDEDKNNLVLQFINEGRYDVADHLLTHYGAGFAPLKDIRSTDDASINSHLGELKKVTGREINRNFLKGCYQPVGDLITGFSLGYFSKTPEIEF